MIELKEANGLNYKYVAFSSCGNHISKFCEEVTAESNKINENILMVFNGTNALCEPGMTARWLEERWKYRRMYYQVSKRIISEQEFFEIVLGMDIIWKEI